MEEDEEEYRFVIVNDIDRPSADHVAQVMPGGDTCRYIHQRLRKWYLLKTLYSTDLRDFGFDYSIDENNGEVIFYRNRPSVVRYEDGSIRDWQDVDHPYSFTLRLWCHQRKEKTL